MLVVAATDRELAHVRNAETFCCGVGPVEAAVSTARALAERAPSAVLHVGIAGARSLPPLSIVLGSQSIYCDVDAAIPVIDRVEPDDGLLRALSAALPEAHLLPIGTSA